MRPLWKFRWKFRFHKMRIISWLAGQLLAYRKGLSSMELVGLLVSQSVSYSIQKHVRFTWLPTISPTTYRMFQRKGEDFRYLSWPCRTLLVTKDWDQPLLHFTEQVVTLQTSEFYIPNNASLIYNKILV